MKQLMLGNQAVARGLFEAGCRFVSSYPGTPSTEISEYASEYEEIYAEWAPNEKVACEAAAILAEQGELVRRQFGYTAGEIPDAQTFALLVEPYRLGALKNAVIRAITIGYGREITAPGDDEYDEGLAELHQKKTRLREPNTSA